MKSALAGSEGLRKTGYATLALCDSADYARWLAVTAQIVTASGRVRTLRGR